jgi:hypothetical protein
MTPLPPSVPFQCTRRVGFLFPHACQRTSPLGCPDCQNGQAEDPYNTRDRSYYSRYDDYDDDYYYASGYGVGFESMGTTYAGDPGDPGDSADAPDSTAMDFTEADGADMVKPDSDFENDMSAS